MQVPEVGWHLTWYNGAHLYLHFRYAREHQPCVIFMDEVDAIGGRRFSEGTSADREIQRTLMELLSQLDGFDVVGKVGGISDALVQLTHKGV
jgi:ATP-dependent 26S proteasome regulatory subunit